MDLCIYRTKKIMFFFPKHRIRLCFETTITTRSILSKWNPNRKHFTTLYLYISWLKPNCVLSLVDLILFQGWFNLIFTKYSWLQYRPPSGFSCCFVPSPWNSRDSPASFRPRMSLTAMKNKYNQSRPYSVW